MKGIPRAATHLKDHRADQRIDRPRERLFDPGTLKTPQHYPPFAEDGEEIQHLDTTFLGLKHTDKKQKKTTFGKTCRG